MEKKIVNIGDRIWYRESGIDSRVTYATVVGVKDYCIVTLQCDAWQETVNLCAIKYYNVNNVPQNISELLDSAAKVHLFDKAKEIGMKEAEMLNSRIELERNTAGPRDTSRTTRSLEEWQRLAQENPVKFSAMRKEFQEDMSSGKI